MYTYTRRQHIPLEMVVSHLVARDLSSPTYWNVKLCLGSFQFVML